MGWVVYEEESGRLVNYYKTRAAARGVVTKHNTERTYDWGDGFGIYHYKPGAIWACCDYGQYEGVLMGLRGEALKMWQFCNTDVAERGRLLDAATAQIQANLDRRIRAVEKG